MRPGREHDTTAVRTHIEILPTLAQIGEDLRTLGAIAKIRQERPRSGWTV